MDWFSWLSKTNLDPSLVYEYSLAFSQNKLEKDDISYFNHETLQSLGISIAKHRLEILKLATKQKSPHPMSKIPIAIARRFSKYLNKLIRREEYVDPSLVYRSCYSERWTNNKSVVDKSKKSSGEAFLLTNGSSILFPSARISSFSNPMMEESNSSFSRTTVRSGDGENWSSSTEEIKWDSMFKNLKPT
ncbi:hypothetical protein PHJA_002602400 [Phtheirospermum japonicum]|uniref:SAM domain-containing protein n=1 Tax=Phtheirospermum japonicum TaxID=374723 RepID=A0A830D7U3_9LAMI|nr:hypothetical protein PHJA_002602400 [Phtheirospermum japonicum]